ncbi:MAG TPA: substrate-binding domain-containing protein [Candidatus Limnocylindria bacterium]|nr:substrate-binding domain-containing protein [Candidatus Limnocylindria bacterium]
MSPNYRRPLWRSLAALAALAAACACAQTLEVVGSSSAKKRLFGPTEAALKAATGIEVKQVGASSGTGLLTVVEGRAAVTATSATLPETIDAASKDAQEKRKSFTPPANLVFHEIAQDRVVAIVHKDNPVPSLTKAQLKDIFSGKVTNWKAVGGADAPIKVITGTSASGTRVHVTKEVMGGAEWVASAKEMRTSADELKAVSLDRNGIGAIGEEVVTASAGAVKTVPGYALVRPVGFITLGAPNPTVQKMIDFLKSPEARKLYAR